MQEFYICVDNLRKSKKSLPKYIQLIELMAEHEVREGHEMYMEFATSIEAEMEVAKSYWEGWQHPEKRLPMTAEEYLIELYLLIEEKYMIPKEFNETVQEFKKWIP
jgi:hypothetical protein